MTIILTLVGVVVFVVSLVTTKSFKTAFWRLAAFAITGFVIDVLIGTLMFVCTLVALN